MNTRLALAAALAAVAATACTAPYAPKPFPDGMTCSMILPGAWKDPIDEGAFEPGVDDAEYLAWHATQVQPVTYVATTWIDGEGRIIGFSWAEDDRICVNPGQA